MANRKVWDKTYIDTHRQAHNERVRRRRKELRAFVQELKEKAGCAQCGVKDGCVLDFHHKEGDKEMTVSRAARVYGWRKERLMAEAAKCVVLCANCHRREHCA